MDNTPPSSPLSSRYAVGAFGKVPKIGDFVRAGLTNEATRAFEEWLHQGVTYAHEKRGSAWKAPFLAGSIYAFVVQVPLGPDRSRGVAGVLKPSQDSVGRAFPLAIFAPLSVDMGPQLLLHALGGFLDEAVVAIDAASRATSSAEVDAALPGAVAIADATPLSWHYESWTRATRLADSWREIYGSDDVGHPARALYTLVEMARPVREGKVASVSLGARFPVGTLGVNAAALWLDLARCAFRSTTPPSFFWFFDGQKGDVFLHLGRPSGSTFTELWCPDPRSETISDLRASAPQRDLIASLPPSLQAVLLRGDASVSDLMQALWFGA